MFMYISKEIGIIALVMAIGYWKDLEGLREVMHSGSGQTIATFSILWFIASFFRMNLIKPWIISILCATGIFILGFGLDKYGLGTSIMFVGVYSLIITIICYQMNPDKGIIFLFGAMSLLVAGGIVIGTCDIKPTHKEYTTVDNSIYLWDIWMEYRSAENNINSKKDVAWPTKEYFKGTRPEAIKYHEEQKKLFMEKNPNIIIIDEHIDTYHTGKV